MHTESTIEMLGLDIARTIIWLALSILICLSPLAVLAASLDDIKAIPNLDSAGLDAYHEFLASSKHRAFAIAPGGAWSWKSGEATVQSASDSALQTCRDDSGQACVVYALDDHVVFDAHSWARLLGPYLNLDQANRAHVGLNRGERFFNLAFADASGRGITLSELRGKVVLLHFWGSWCPHCRSEMPDLQRLHKSLEPSADIQMVLLQVQENFQESSRWMLEQHLNFPLSDSGIRAKEMSMLTLANGMKIRDRDIAPAFPATYILDKHGIVVFSNIGPVAHWPQYLPLLRDVAARSGK
jgi:thiol-disulfide isomerase/thioredoxin